MEWQRAKTRGLPRDCVRASFSFRSSHLVSSLPFLGVVLLLPFFAVRPWSTLQVRLSMSDGQRLVQCTSTCPLRPPTDWDRPKAFCPGWALVPLAVTPCGLCPCMPLSNSPSSPRPFRTPDQLWKVLSTEPCSGPGGEVNFWSSPTKSSLHARAHSQVHSNPVQSDPRPRIF